MTLSNKQAAERLLVLDKEASDGAIAVIGGHVHTGVCCIADCCSVGDDKQAHKNAQFFAASRVHAATIATAYIEAVELLKKHCLYGGTVIGPGPTIHPVYPEEVAEFLRRQG